MSDDAEFWAGQWAELAGIAAKVTNTADAVMDAMRGDVGLPRGATAAQAAPIIRDRIAAYVAAKQELREYIAAVKAALEQVAADA